MQLLGVSGAVRPLYGSLGVKGLIKLMGQVAGSFKVVIKIFEFI
jgi:hypothetical protein